MGQWSMDVSREDMSNTPVYCSLPPCSYTAFAMPHKQNSGAVTMLGSSARLIGTSTRTR